MKDSYHSNGKVIDLGCVFAGQIITAHVLSCEVTEIIDSCNGPRKVIEVRKTSEGSE
jgi:hypothetical protein